MNFSGWLDERYHKEIHETTKQMPLERWQQEEDTIKRVAPEKLREALKMREYRKVDFRTALVHLNGRTYQASKSLGGERIQARWVADCVDEIDIWKDGEFREKAMLFVPTVDIDYSKRPEREPELRPGIVVESAKNYRLGLMARRSGESFVPGQRTDDLLAESEFSALLEILIGRQFDGDESKQISVFFRKWCPFRRDFIQDVLTRCTAEKGCGLHIKVYLRRIEETLQKLR